MIDPQAIHDQIDALVRERDWAVIDATELDQAVKRRDFDIAGLRATIVDRDATIAVLEARIAQLTALLPKPGVRWGINAPFIAELGGAMPQEVRIFNQGSILTAATVTALQWCDDNGVRPKLSFAIFPNVLPAATAQRVADLCPEGDFTTDHEPTKPGKMTATQPDKVKANSHESNRIMSLHAPGWVPGYICMAYDVYGGVANRHPDLFMGPSAKWIGYDTYDASDTGSNPAKTFEWLINKPLAYARSKGLPVHIPEVACRPDRVGGPNYRNFWITEMAEFVKANPDIVAVDWFSADTGATASFLPEGWHLPQGGGQAVYKAIVEGR